MKLHYFSTVLLALALVLPSHSSQNGKLKIFKTKEVRAYTNQEYEESRNGCSWYCADFNVSCTSSSTLPKRGNLGYEAQKSHDKDITTAWVEGNPDYGIGESLTFEFSTKSSNLAATGFFIANGYRKSKQLWRENSRVKTFKMYVNGRPYGVIQLRDVADIQQVEFGRIPLKPNKPLKLTFEILEVYPGEKYSDTAVTEIEFNGDGAH